MSETTTGTSISEVYSELLGRGHQRFWIDPEPDDDRWTIDLVLPEILVYGIPEAIDLTEARLEPEVTDEGLLIPLFMEKQDYIGFFLDVNMPGVYWDQVRKKFGIYHSLDELGVVGGSGYERKLRFSRILRSLGMPFEFFQEHQGSWPVIDPDRPNEVPEYYFQEAIEIWKR